MMKPDYKSYRRRQFSKFPFLVRCDQTGALYKEINGERHKNSFMMIASVIPGILLLLYLVLSHTLSIEVKRELLHFIFIADILLMVTLPILARIICTKISYKISNFEILDERELIKYPGSILSLEWTDKRRKRRLLTKQV